MNTKHASLSDGRLWLIGVVLAGALLSVSGEVLAQRTASAEAMLQQALDHFSNWRLSEAEQAFEQAQAAGGPSDAEILQSSALFKRFRGEYGEALRLQQRVLALEPDNPNYLFQLGITHKYMRNYEAAMTALRRSVALAPALVSGYSNLAITATAQGDHAQALRYLQVAEHTARQQFAEAMPDWRLAQMAYAYAQLGHREDVIRLADELERQRPPASDVAWAMTYMALGDYVQGLARLAAVIEQRQGAVGGVRQLLGDIAANTYSDPVLEGPGFQEALRALWGGT